MVRDHSHSSDGAHRSGHGPDHHGPGHHKPDHHGPDHHGPGHHKSDHHGPGHHHAHPRRRPSRFGFFVRIAVLAVALVFGVGGGLWLKAYNTDSSAGYTDDLAGKVQSQCEQFVARLDCRCFWKQAGAVFTPSSSAAILEILSQRHQWTGQITRARLEQVVGNDGASMISKALYYCTVL